MHLVFKPPPPPQTYVHLSLYWRCRIEKEGNTGVNDVLRTPPFLVLHCALQASFGFSFTRGFNLAISRGMPVLTLGFSGLQYLACLPSGVGR